MPFRFSVPLFRVAGIPVRMSLFFPLLAVLALVSTPGYTTGSVAGRILAGFAILFVSVLLHEGGHAFAARRDRLAVEEIEIHLLGGHTLHQPCRTTGSELRVSLAGVAVNFALALAAFAAHWSLTGASPGRPVLSLYGEWLPVVWALNLYLALLNLLPGIPFDGGHAAEALLARKYGRVRARTSVLISGAIIGAGILLLGISSKSVLMTMIGISCLTAVGSGWRRLKEEPADERLLGTYDFSNGYTSLDASDPPPAKEPKARVRERERVRREVEDREAAAARAAVEDRNRLDRLLDRIAAEGISSLSPEERAFLNAESRRLRDRGRTPTR